MGHPQPPTPMQVNNTTTQRFIDSTLKEKRTKSIDIKYHWLKDREQQQQFKFYWRPRQHNIANPFTKHHLKCRNPYGRPIRTLESKHLKAGNNGESQIH